MNYRKQAGMNSLLLLFVLAMCGFLLMAFFKLGPPYLDNMYITDALKQLAEDHPDDLAQLSKTKIRSELSKYYTINNVRGEAAKSLEIERLREKTIVTVLYEVRVPFFANVDAVITFNNVLDSSDPKACCSVSDKE